MSPLVAVAELDRVGKSLRRQAEEIRACAPALAAKLDGLSRECETKREEIDRRLEPRALVVPTPGSGTAGSVLLKNVRCPTPCHCAECRT